MDKYSQLLERIATSSGLTQEEIDRKIEAKRAKLSGLISKEGAAQIVAAELGVNFDNQRMKLGELSEGQKRVRIVGKITKVMPTRSYEKNGKSGKVGSFFVGDESSNTRVVLWDTAHITLIDEGQLKEGDVVEVGNASVRNGELQLSAFSELKKSAEVLQGVKASRTFNEGQLKDAQPGNGMKVRALVVQLYDPKYFDGKDGGKRALVNAILDDGSETMRALLGPEQLKQLGLEGEDVFDLEKFAVAKSGVLGEEYYFTGTCKINTYFNKPEFSISGVEKVDVEQLLQELEARA